MAICANQGRMYMGTARQYMENQCCAQPKPQPEPVRMVPGCDCRCGCQRDQTIRCREDGCQRDRMLRYREDGCQPDSLCADLPLTVAYVNPQPYTGLVSGEVALSRGSAFNNLYDPWTPGQYC